ncbi:MAG: histidinol-phosphate transaminase [Lachnospiraceae bacterium]|nr:histidinol-phosphate transaminase [Lachnospiraceae bacterium]
MNNELKKNLRNVVPYVPGEQPKVENIIKLNTNENPYPPTPLVKKVLDGYNVDSLRLYPDPASSDLVNALAKRYNVKPSQVFTGIGSDDVLALCFMAYFNSGKPVIFPEITYSFYKVWAELFNTPYETFSLNEDLTVNVSDFIDRENGGLLIANPNAPTGIALSKADIRKICEANQDVVVIVDEAYVDFAEDSMVDLVDEYENLVVVQTFSKSRSMAGMRIGYAIGNEELIKVLNDVRYSFNSYPLTRLSVCTGVAAIEDEDTFRENIEKIKKTREWTKGELTRLGFTFPDSETNFIFATHKSVKAVDIFNKLKEKHIFVRYFNSPKIDNYLRITIGTDDEMKTFIEEVEKIVV